MKAIVVSERGNPSVLQLQNVAKPIPKPGEVLLKVKAAGVNFVDIMQHQGSYPRQLPTPYIPGMEVAGIVADVGEGVSNTLIGSRVAAITAFAGGYAEYAVVPRQQLVPLPDGISDRTALALLVQGLSAFFLLNGAGRLKSGESVLVHAAAGGVGNMAVQIAKLMGAGLVIGTASSEKKRSRLYEIGVDCAVNYTDPNWSQEVLTATQGQGVDIILDSVGASMVSSNLYCIATGGRFVTYGWLSGEFPVFTSEQMKGILFKNQSITGFAVDVWIEQHPEQFNTSLQQLFTWSLEGKLHPVFNPTFSLKDAAFAHTAILNRETSGKVILTVDGL
ncbi:zinc-binding dehydrogenase [Scytonema sp. UIC 10036]|uniref:quinone oxidoreductase family protein n=1 Tax=Scytonema sp. UIC 10036 TaxID=2304196 RepID=UPI00140FB977|nr:zinc-binding dehydrogenase [Scytonema sp. UIC 10036]